MLTSVVALLNQIVVVAKIKTAQKLIGWANISMNADFVECRTGSDSSIQYPLDPWMLEIKLQKLELIFFKYNLPIKPQFWFIGN